MSDDALTIAGYRAQTMTVTVPGGGGVPLYTVRDLERYVDRGALLRGDEEPPYWAHLWTGARLLAAYIARWVPTRGKTVVDLGCGLGLTGIVAARGGADVLFVDSVAAALEFVTASARLNGVPHRTMCADFRALPPGDRFDLVVASEVAYDPPTFGDLASVIARHLAPDGIALVADGYRTDTRPLYRALATASLAVHGLDLRVPEAGRTIPLRITALRHLRGAAKRA